MTYQYQPTSFAGQSLTAAPFERCFFRYENSPAAARPMRVTEASRPEAATVDVRADPEPTTWELHALLVDAEQATLEAASKVFSEEHGLAYLHCNDGQTPPVTWRVACRVIGRDIVAGRLMLVRLRVPHPLFEEVGVDTAAATATTGNSLPLTVVNDGNRWSQPLIKVRHAAAKNTRLDDWRECMRAFIVNRSPYALSNYPVNIFARDNGSQVLDTASIVKISGSYNPISQAGGISATATTIPIGAAVGGGVDSPDGMGYIGDGVQNGGAYEQIYYTNNTGTQLTGCVRGVGGTTAYAWANGTPIYRSRMLANGDDIEVWVNGVRVERWLADMNKATTKCWINISAPPRQRITLVKRLEDSGNDIEVQEDISDWPESGHIAFGAHVQSGMELVSYRGRDLAARKFLLRQRGAWGTSQFSWGAGTPNGWGYRVSHLVVIGSNKARALRKLADTEPERKERRPCIQLAFSDNDRWRWGNNPADPSMFLDNDFPNRPASFAPDPEVPASDQNNAIPTRLRTSSGEAGWSDGAPVPGAQQVGAISLWLPTGVLQGGVGAQPILISGFLDSSVRLQLHTDDAQGVRKLVVDSRGVPGVTFTDNIIPTDHVIHRLRLGGVRAAVTGSGLPAQIRGYAIFDGALEGFVVKLVLDQETEVDAVDCYLRITAGTTGSFRYKILDSSGSTPETGRVLWEADTFTPAVGTTAAWIEGTQKSPRERVTLQAGTYWLMFEVQSVAGGRYEVAVAPTSTRNNEMRVNNTGTWQWASADPAVRGTVALFRLIHRRGGPIQPEALALAEGRESRYTAVTLRLNNASSDPYTPAVWREASPSDLALVHTNGRLTNQANSKALTLDAWLVKGEDLIIDCANRTVTWQQGAHVLRIPGALAADDPTEWFRLEPGSNALTWSEDALTNFTLTVEHRGKRV